MMMVRLVVTVGILALLAGVRVEMVIGAVVLALLMMTVSRRVRAHSAGGFDHEGPHR